MAERSKTRVCSLALAGVAGSNPGVGMKKVKPDKGVLIKYLGFTKGWGYGIQILIIIVTCKP